MPKYTVYVSVEKEVTIEIEAETARKAEAEASHRLEGEYLGFCAYALDSELADDEDSEEVDDA